MLCSSHVFICTVKKRRKTLIIPITMSVMEVVNNKPQYSIYRWRQSNIFKHFLFLTVCKQILIYLPRPTRDLRWDRLQIQILRHSSLRRLHLPRQWPGSWAGHPTAWGQGGQWPGGSWSKTQHKVILFIYSAHDSYIDIGSIYYIT